MADKFSDEALAEFLSETPPVSAEKKVKDAKDDEKPVIKHEKPEWADNKNDDYNTYEYSDNPNEDDSNW